MEDYKIVELYLQRSEAAIMATAERYGWRLRTLAYGIVGDFSTAQEIENDTYLQAWGLIPPHEPRDYFYAFLAKITRHIALNCCRDRERLKRSAYIVELSREMEECIPAPDHIETCMERKELARMLNGFLATLTEERRNIFLRRYWFMDSICAIAQRFGYSESKVKSLLFRCRKQLLTYLEKEGYDL